MNAGNAANSARSELPILALGGVFVLTLLIGGGTSAGLLTDSILQVVTIVVCVSILVTKASTNISWPLLVFPMLILLAIALQLVPLPVQWVQPYWPSAVKAAWVAADPGSHFGFITTNVERTLGVFTYAASAMVLLWTLGSLQPSQLGAIVSYIALGIFANMLVAFIQLSLRQFEPINDILSYPIKVGFFANQNHFATLLLITIPFLDFRYYWGPHLRSLLNLAMVMFFLLAAGSIAGIVVGFVLSIISFAVLSKSGLQKSLTRAVILLALAAFGAGAWQQIFSIDFAAKVKRIEIFRTTLDAIRDAPVTGSGYGSFVQTYQIFEKAKDINAEYINHAHNDFAELIMEGGLIAAALIGLYLVLLIYKFVSQFHRTQVRAAFLSILAVLTHSLVDYPLRTMAIMYLFVYAHAVMFAADASTPQRELEPKKKSRKRRSKSEAIPAVVPAI